LAKGAEQHTPSRHAPELHWLSAVHATPDASFWQTPVTQVYPLVMSQSALVMHDVRQDIVVGSHRKARHIVVGPGAQVPAPSHDPKLVKVVVPAGHERVPHIRPAAPS
jgi:hypothetical protein